MRILKILKVFMYSLPFIGVLVAGLFAFSSGLISFGSDDTKESTSNNTVKTARVVADGDILMHDILYTSAKKADGTYDFEPYFKYVKDIISAADLAIGDYEGTITDKAPLAGYPLFNAPKEIALTLKIRVMIWYI